MTCLRRWRGLLCLIKPRFPARMRLHTFRIWCRANTIGRAQRCGNLLTTSHRRTLPCFATQMRPDAAGRFVVSGAQGSVMS